MFEKNLIFGLKECEIIDLASKLYDFSNFLSQMGGARDKKWSRDKKWL